MGPKPRGWGYGAGDDEVAVGGLASMGPGHAVGDTVSCPPSIAPISALQWSPGHAAGDTPGNPAEQTAVFKLQWGPDHAARDTGRARLSRFPWCTGFNWARPCGRGYRPET